MLRDTLKIMIVGLENVGKTSILYTLEKKYSLLGILGPTKGIERSTFKIFGYQVSAWDLGGQESYRKSYLQKKGFFEQTDLLIYCVDAVASPTIELSLDYYKKILEIFNEIHQSPPILILLHKVDPDIKNKPEIRQNISKLIKMFKDVSTGFEVAFFETTIYDELSLITAFSFGLRELSTKTEVISQHLADFAKKIMANAIILLSQNGYLIAEYASNQMSALSCQSISTHSIYMYLILAEKAIIPEKITVDLKDEFIIFKKVTILDEDFFIVFSSKVTRSLNLFDEYFPKFAQQSADIFKFFFQ